MSDRDDDVDRLLHDAEHAESGVGVARMMGDHEAAARMMRKAIDLREQAEKLDPKHEAPAWAEDEKWGNR